MNLTQLTIIEGGSLWDIWTDGTGWANNGDPIVFLVDAFFNGATVAANVIEHNAQIVQLGYLHATN